MADIPEIRTCLLYSCHFGFMGGTFVEVSKSDVTELNLKRSPLLPLLSGLEVTVSPIAQIESGTSGEIIYLVVDVSLMCHGTCLCVPVY